MTHPTKPPAPPDATGLETLRAELEEARQMLVSIEEIAHLGRWEWDFGSDTMEGSERLFAIYGLPPGSALDRETFLERVLPEDREEVARTIEAVATQGEPQEAKFRILPADGKIRWIHVRARMELDATGAPLRMVGTSQDVTEREETLAELRRSELRFREMADHIRETFWLFDWKAGRVIYASPAYETIWGKPVEELYQRYEEWTESIHPEDREASARSFEEITLAGKEEAREYRIVRPDGAVRWISDRGFVIRDSQGEIVRVAGIAEDITERKQVEREQLALQAKIRHRQKLESLGVLAGGIAHDFNNLLMAIVGNADLALEDLPEASRSRKYVDQIARTAETAAELTQQMLAYSGRGQVQIGRVRINQLVEEMASLLQTVVSKKTQLVLDTKEEGPLIEADAGQLRQIIMNLILNASEALEGATGSVRLSTGTVELDAAALRRCYLADQVKPGRYAYLEVADSGQGMDPETLDRLFEPFFTTKFTGRGLGLAAVLGNIRGHRGTIRVESEPDGGSTLTVYLPLLAEGSVEVRPPESNGSPEGVGGTLLVVDDEQHVLSVMQKILEHAGFETLGASGGPAALELYRQRGAEISLVLLDMTMPAMDGEEVHRALSEIDPGVRVLLCSGFAEEDAARRFSGLPLAGFLHKPFRAEVLIARVNEALSKG